MLKYTKNNLGAQCVINCFKMQIAARYSPGAQGYRGYTQQMLADTEAFMHNFQLYQCSLKTQGHPDAHKASAMVDLQSSTISCHTVTIKAGCLNQGHQRCNC